MLCCGAEISGRTLHLAIVGRNGGDLTYIRCGTTKMALEDDEDQASVHTYFQSLAAFLRSNRVDIVAVKKRFPKGPFAGGPLTFKIEGLLQMLDGIGVSLLAPATIAALDKKHKFPIPPELFKYQEDAFKTACCALVGR
jgi:hypothetical protein